MPNVRPIRRGQLITPFGVGALVNFREDESLMTAGLDEWPDATEECPRDWLVQEERLQVRLGVTHFRLPPDYREPGQGVQLANKYIPFVRFPRWHYCPRRGAMEQLSLFGSRSRCPCRPGLDCHSLHSTRRPWLIPSRFIAVCPKGHIDDFPFMEWVHREGSWDNTHKLRLFPGRSSANLSGIGTRIQCNCGRTESMTGTFNFDREKGGALHRIGYDCSGKMPWLGTEGRRGTCGEYLRVVQRGASNVYFPLTVSSIYLPLWGEGRSRNINRILEDEDVWGTLTSRLDDGRYVRLDLCETVVRLRRSYELDAEELRDAAQKRLDGDASWPGTSPRSEEEFRRQEYEALRAGRGGDTTDLMVEVCDTRRYGVDLAELMDKLCIVKKLRETRVLTGFSRLLPVEDHVSANLLPMSVDKDLSWLPATVVYGEGIFFEFSARKIATWAHDGRVKDRVLELTKSYNERRLERGLEETEITPKYVLLHTFAHILISQLSFDCGYGSASLRERIYCDSDDPDRPMQGVLIYTASGDSEGTLGGLVRQGKTDRLIGVFERAVHRARWCSSDPVCIESTGQGSDNANLAACHGCVLLPETSCETGNRLLDRGLIVGTWNQREIGFFRNVYST